jgi:hypothetical protein
VGLLTSGKILPSELVESLIQLSPKELEAEPFGPLLLVLQSPADPSGSFLADLLHSALRDGPPLSQGPGWLSTGEMPTVRVPNFEAPDPDQVELLAELAGATHCIIPLLRQDGSARTLTLGRAPQNHIVVSDPSVSGEHAELSVQDEGVRILDRGSKNGTFHNGTAMTPGKRLWLQPMDRLTFGRVAAFTCDPRTLRAVLRSDLRSLF